MMIQRLVFAVLAAFGIGLAASVGAVESVGTLPAPTLTDVRVTATTDYDADNKLYTYDYDLSNGAESTGTIFIVSLDMINKYSGGDWHNNNGLPAHPADQLTIPQGGNGGTAKTFAQQKKEAEPLLLPPGRFLIPYGIHIPDGWSGHMSRDGYAAFAPRAEAYRVQPGDTVKGLTLISPGVPVIREMIVEPFWVPVFDEEPDKQEAAKAGKVERDIRVHLKTLGPAGTGALGWSALDSEVAEATELGWIPDAALAQAIHSQLDAANAAAVQERDGTAAKQQLGELLDMLASASAEQIRPEARDLVRLNLEALIRVIPNTPIPVTPKAALEPVESAHTLGETAALTATLVNASDHNKPLPGWHVVIRIDSGPNQDQVGQLHGSTDADGEASFSYTGRGVGTDKVRLEVLSSNGEESGLGADAEVHWQGGVDLVVPLFVPPMIKSKGGQPIEFLDLTKNQGDQPAGASVTRYYLSPEDAVDPSRATVLAERRVPPLGPGEQSEADRIRTTLPTVLAEGVYHLLACADADEQIVEIDETNNCSDSQLENVTSIVVSADPSTNDPPVCDAARPREPLLWPPNHKLHEVRVDGVTDPDGDEVTLTVTGIEQSEPVNGQGDGDTAPDGFGVGSDRAQVRAERSGGGQGRLYFVHFDAADGQGGNCTGSVAIGVPHDRSAKGLPADTGERYDSTQF